MKQTKVYSILLFLLLVITSCEEAGITFPESQENITSSGVFEVSFDGALFSTSNVDYITDNDQTIITVNNTDTNEIFTLKVSAVATGTYDLMGLDNYATYINNSNPNTADIWTTIDSSIKAGELTITEIDEINNTISGTFSFSGINAITGAVKQFTTGSFSKIPQGTGTTPVASNNTFTAKVDGVAYTATSVSGSLVKVGNTDLILLVGNKSFSETIGIT